MPIGSADIPPALGGNVSTLVDALFATNGGVAPPRGYLANLINIANDASGSDYLNNNLAAFLQAPALAPALPATAPGFAGPPLGRLLQCDLTSLLNPAEAQTMLQTWSQFWIPPAVGAPLPIHPSDANLLGALRGYLHDPTGMGTVPPLVMWEPVLNYDGLTADGKLRLHLTAYNRSDFIAGGAWVPATVTRFLQLLAFGAHFVVIHAPQDLNLAGGAIAPPPFFAEFERLFVTVPRAANQPVEARAATMHSHYSGVPVIPATNLAAAYTYPALIDDEVAPANCPYIAAFLTGRTAWRTVERDGFTLRWSNQFNTFFQLEGWPGTNTRAGRGGLGGRHGADFAAHQATKWNISTFGASVYSEKRGTTVFLAPPPPLWGPPVPTPGTIMAPDPGALTPQGWLDTTLIR